MSTVTLESSGKIKPLEEVSKHIMTQRFFSVVPYKSEDHTLHNTFMFSIEIIPTLKVINLHLKPSSDIKTESTLKSISYEICLYSPKAHFI